MRVKTRLQGLRPVCLLLCCLLPGLVAASGIGVEYSRDRAGGSSTYVDAFLDATEAVDFSASVGTLRDGDSDQTTRIGSIGLNIDFDNRLFGGARLLHWREAETLDSVNLEFELGFEFGAWRFGLLPSLADIEVTLRNAATLDVAGTGFGLMASWQSERLLLAAEAVQYDYDRNLAALNNLPRLALQRFSASPLDPVYTLNDSVSSLRASFLVQDFDLTTALLRSVSAVDRVATTSVQFGIDFPLGNDWSASAVVGRTTSTPDSEFLALGLVRWW